LKKSAEKENVAASNVKSVVEPEKKAKKVVPASVKKAVDGQQQPGYVRVMSMKVSELRSELRQRNLDTTGLKKDLQKRLLEDITVEESKKQESKSGVKSAVKASMPAIAKDGDGDVRMEDAETSDSRRDSSKMDVDEDAALRPDASAVKTSAKKEKVAAKEATVAKSFLKNTADLFSPGRIAAKMHSAKKEMKTKETASVPLAVAKETNQKPVATQSGRSSLTDGLKKTASAILSASPVRKAPVSKSTKSPYPKGSAVKAKPVVHKQEDPVEEEASSE